MNVIAEAVSPDALAHDTQLACVVQPVVLAGGSGTRLWPLSREQCPKQLIGLTSDESLLEATLRRTQGLRAPTPDRPAPHAVKTQPTLVVCSEELRLPTKERLERCTSDSRIVLEPAPRNTAPALTVAALAAISAAPEGGDPVLVVMPADHLIADTNAFVATLQQAIQHALADAIVALGVPPERAETGYGYIRTGAAADGHGARSIDRFVEKPAQELAEQYLASGEYWWNSGIFVMRASVWLAAIAACRPDIAAACQVSYEQATVDGDGTVHIDRAAFAACPSDSIDYAVMERIGNDPKLAGVIVPLTAGWSDVGAWDAVWDVSAKDDAGNVARGRVLLEGASDTYAHSEGRLVACVGVSGVVVVETADAVLVAAKDRVQDVKAIVNRLNAAKHTEAKVHRKVERPWGCYDSIDHGERFQVKRIVVKPGGRLSLQMHHHRAEHWVVVRGTARVTRGDETFLLTENQSTYIPLGTLHRLENPGKTPLEIIEVQSGGYLGEDDIVRFDDQYGRTGT
ncbi:Mannose-6-phosphate isomerase / Mannose-1-phosphate guanylyl transferase [Paraburkholderia sabiae]|uniref:mannose-1-phosphate guanylyltransferase/mannose-6-phosphate isomerase n=1 Tax=Paraburkholderia sabiae TaxID=273251 RepID=UPI001CAAE0DB|nr:mannose-1-phosphate guanylyltransferase/mannose-6-phosphate isomerase [Paraburkholderia sabiae]CAG9213350.1 Mannose-6-phosphate isomerase / Mannose-1-phosphate guanylyl transferase [Paraburkholderia sabiae]